MKKINGTNYKRSLEAITKQIAEAEKDDQKVWFKYLNDMLDELHSDDFFGTEGQNDPRGDHRDQVSCKRLSRMLFYVGGGC